MEPRWFAATRRVSIRINRVFVAISGALAVVIMVVILQDVVRRYAFNDPTTWALDISSFLLVYLFFFALAPALEHGSHVTVDLFGRLLPVGVRRPVEILGGLLLVGFAVVLFAQLLDTTVEAFHDNNLFPTATPVRMKYVWIIGPVGAAQFILTALVLLAGTMFGRIPAD